MPAKEFVQALFSQLAPIYDLGNRLMTLGQDKYWRHRAAIKAQLHPHALALDICTGTADLAIELAQIYHCQVIGSDFCLPMLRLGMGKIQKRGLNHQIKLILADAAQLPLKSATFDCATLSFARRDLSHLTKTLKEAKRILKPTGKLILLELTNPKNRMLKPLHHLYLHHFIPFAATLLHAKKEHYTYLAQSINNFIPPDRLRQLLQNLEFKHLQYFPIMASTANIWLAHK